jgi:hypothetical protein
LRRGDDGRSVSRTRAYNARALAWRTVKRHWRSARETACACSLRAEHAIARGWADKEIALERLVAGDGDSSTTRFDLGWNRATQVVVVHVA